MVEELVGNLAFKVTGKLGKVYKELNGDNYDIICRDKDGVLITSNCSIVNTATDTEILTEGRKCFNLAGWF